MGRARRIMSDDELAELRQLWMAGTSVKAIALTLGRHRNAIPAEADRLGLPKRVQAVALNPDARDCRHGAAILPQRDEAMGPRPSEGAVAALYAGRRYEDNPGAVEVGRLVSISRRTTSGYARSETGCAAAMCAEQRSMRS